MRNHEAESPRSEAICITEIERGAFVPNLGVSAVIPHFYLLLLSLRGCVLSRWSGYLYAEGKSSGKHHDSGKRRKERSPNLYHEFPFSSRAFGFFHSGTISIAWFTRCYYSVSVEMHLSIEFSSANAYISEFLRYPLSPFSA
jgi:hypothetical protein